jgi:6-phosphogluconolactonase
VRVTFTCVDDVAGTYARIVESALEATPAGETLRLGCSGGSTGRMVMERLVAAGLDWPRIDLFFADERCVEPSSPASNEHTIREALGAQLERLHGFHPMRCEMGPQAYESLLAAIGRLDVLQLGVGPDGHTASLFASSPGLVAAPGRLVVENEDPSGVNPYLRMTLTYEAIARARLVVMTVAGADKHEILARVFAGEDLPAARVRADRVVWLVDHEAAGSLPVEARTAAELATLGRISR